MEKGKQEVNMKNKAFVKPELVQNRLNEVINSNLLNEDELNDILIRVEEDMIIEKAQEIQKNRNPNKGPSFNGVF